ncbi:ATPase [Pelagibacteraceae bacterium]|nr:ATPase [Pelagibacteraceae bacterium]
MNFDATFWVAVSFVLFVGVLIYFKVPQKIFTSLDESINKIKKDIEEAEKLKEEAKNILSDYEAKLDKSKVEIDLMIKNAQKESESNIIKINDQFHKIFENRKKMAEEKIKQMKLQATKDIKNYSVEVAIIALEKIIKNSIDKKKLDKIYVSSVNEAKKILKNKSI